MFEELKLLIKNAKAKYSNFCVASIIVDKDNNKYSGVNIEYDVPTNSICAERNAIANAFTNGMQPGDLKEVHVLGMNKTNSDEDMFVPPCGICRQAIVEISNYEAEIFLYNLKGESKKYSIMDLLPEAFTGKEI